MKKFNELENSLVKELNEQKEKINLKKTIDIYKYGATNGGNMFFHKKEKEKEEEKIILGKMYLKWEHEFWGDSIVIEGNGRGYCFGNELFKNDIIAVEMQSEKVMALIITGVHYQSDPPDMLFFDYKYLGYLNKLGKEPYFINNKDNENVLLNSDKKNYKIPECMKPDPIIVNYGNY